MTQWVTYLQSVLMARAKQSDLTSDRLQELRTFCEVLNLFGHEKVTVAADVLVQRFKVLEQRALGQSGSAHGLELVDEQRSALVGDEELRLTTAKMRARARLRNLPAICG